MRVLVACEESQVVCNAFRERGHEAFSCDLVPTRGKHPEWHIQKNVMEVIDGGWDIMVAFPPCDHLAVSGARWFKEKREDGRQDNAARFFLAIATAQIPKIAIENPIGIMSTCYRKPDQIIQPWMFGHQETKATCLWLKGLSKLRETKNVYDEMIRLPEKERNRIHHMCPGPNRSRDRAVTYQGIADAMASQWGSL